MLDFELLMKDRGYWVQKRWNEGKHQYTFETGTIIEFFSADTYGKAHGPRRDILYLNECNNLHYNIVQQLMLRTRKIVWMDWNPSADFWYYSEIEGKRDDVDFLHLTFEDNEALDEGSKREILSMKDNSYLWTVYGLGLQSEPIEKIYKDWKVVGEVPHEARLISYGLDFGYTNDPTGICQIFYLNGGFIVHEIAYTKGLSNKNIADIILAHDSAPVIADAAEPKSIDELRLYGLTVIPSTKGKGAVSQRIVFVQSQRMSITSQSVNFIKNYRNYLFIKDKNGKVTNEPHHAFSHGMDAVGYGLQIKRSSDKPSYEQPAWESPMDTEFTPISAPSIPQPRASTYEQPAYQSPMDGDYGDVPTNSLLGGLRNVDGSV